MPCATNNSSSIPPKTTHVWSDDNYNGTVIAISRIVVSVKITEIALSDRISPETAAAYTAEDLRLMWLRSGVWRKVLERETGPRFYVFWATFIIHEELLRHTSQEIQLRKCISYVWRNVVMLPSATSMRVCTNFISFFCVNEIYYVYFWTYLEYIAKFRKLRKKERIGRILWNPSF